VKTRAIYREVIDLLARLDGIDFRQTAPVRPGTPFLKPYGQEWTASEEILSRPLPGIAPTTLVRAGALDQGNLILNLEETEARGIADGVMFLAGSAINSIKNAQGKYDPALGALATPNPFIGLCDRKATPWPAFHAFSLLVHELDGFATAERVASETDAELTCFRFDGGRPTRWVAWLPDAKTRGQADPLPTRKVLLEAVRGAVTVHTVPTTMDEPAAIDLDASVEGLRLDLTPTPVILTGRP
jgi:hypothetical protein